MAGSAREQTIVPVPKTVPPPAVRLRAVGSTSPPCPAFAPEDSGLSLQSHVSWHEDDLVAKHIRVRKGAVLLLAGQPFTALFAVQSGSCKSVVTTASGHEQIAAFHIAGEILGTEAICEHVYDATVVALEDSEFRSMPFDRVEALAQCNDYFRRSFDSLMSRQIRRERKVTFWVTTMRAEQRVAAFLLDLADRYGARGYSSHEFVLRMTRHEIGIHLGLSHETVSRLLSNFHRQRLVRVQGRELAILDRVALQGL